MINKENNKFHDMKFTIGHNHNNLSTTLNKDLEKIGINDDFSNETQLKYEYPVQGKNAKTQLVDALQESDIGHNYYNDTNK